MEFPRDDPTRPPGGADRHGRTCHDPRLRHRHARAAAAETIAAADRPDAPGLRSATEGAGGARASGRVRLIDCRLATACRPQCGNWCRTCIHTRCGTAAGTGLGRRCTCCRQRLQPGHLADPVGQLRQPVAGPGRATASTVSSPAPRSARVCRASLSANPNSTISANVDPWFFGSLNVALEADNSASVEEAFVQTTALPAGLGAARPGASFRASAT